MPAIVSTKEIERQLAEIQAAAAAGRLWTARGEVIPLLALCGDDMALKASVVEKIIPVLPVLAAQDDYNVNLTIRGLAGDLIRACGDDAALRNQAIVGSLAAFPALKSHDEIFCFFVADLLAACGGDMGAMGKVVDAAASVLPAMVEEKRSATTYQLVETMLEGCGADAAAPIRGRTIRNVLPALSLLAAKDRMTARLLVYKLLGSCPSDNLRAEVMRAGFAVLPAMAKSERAARILITDMHNAVRTPFLAGHFVRGGLGVLADVAARNGAAVRTLVAAMLDLVHASVAELEADVIDGAITVLPLVEARDRRVARALREDIVKACGGLEVYRAVAEASVRRRMEPAPPGAAHLRGLQPDRRYSMT